MSGGRYALELEGDARAAFDVWLVGHDVGDALLPPRLDGVFAVDDGTVRVPGTARGVITVGATVSRDRIEGASGEVVLGAEVSSVAPFSSVGPLPDGRPKPDLVAPGAILAVALSSDVDPDDPRGLFGGSRGLYERLRLPDGRVAVQGSSFSAAIAAGVLALSLGDAARLETVDPATDARLLAWSARPPGDAPWSAEAGFGALDAAAFFEARASALATGEVARADLSATRPAELGADFHVAGRAFDARGAPFTGTLALRPDGADVTTPIPVADGVFAERVPTPRGLPGASVAYALLDERGAPLATLTIPLRVDPARERLPPTARGGGGCAVLAPSPRAFPFPAALVFLALLLTPRRSRRRATNRGGRAARRGDAVK
jgi:subtilisin family serine protease